MNDPRGKYRIQSVAEMTGVAAATLRAWERRYGVPVPARTASSYRLYSDLDIDMIRKLRELCDEGMSPSDAARLVLEELESTPTPTPVPTGGDPFAPTRTALLEAIEQFDPRRLERELDRATALGTATTIVEHVLRPVLVAVGDAWHDGRMTVAQEHLATEAITSVTRRLLSLVQPDGDAPLVLLACFADEEHGYSALALGVHLASWGWRVVFLGPRTPPDAIKHAVVELEPALVCLSCTVAMTAHRARELVDGYAAAVGGRPWIVGGLGAPNIAPFVLAAGGGVSQDNDPRTLRAAIEKLVAPTPRRKPR